jgi:dipeptidase
MSYALYIGKDLTADGVGYLAGYGDEPSSHWLEVVPRQTHSAGEVIEVGVTPQADLPGVRSTIPQAAETFRYLSVGYSFFVGVPAPLTNGGLNEHGVAVRDVWSHSHQRLVDLTPPDQSGPSYSDLARLVLQRCRSAREGVALIGALIGEYGESTYGGNSHLIADADEAWVVIEFAGGADRATSASCRTTSSLTTNSPVPRTSSISLSNAAGTGRRTDRSTSTPSTATARAGGRACSGWRRSWRAAPPLLTG